MVKPKMERSMGNRRHRSWNIEKQQIQKTVDKLGFGNKDKEKGA